METRTHSGSIKHLDVEPMLAKGSKDGEKKNFSLVDRSSAHNDDDTIKFIDQELAKVAFFEEDGNICGCKDSTYRIISGIIIVILIAVSWTGVTQFGRSIYRPHFTASFFTTWFTTCFQALIYPIFMIPLMCRKSPWRLRTFLRQTAEIFGPTGFCLKSVVVFTVKTALPFTILWVMWNYFYYRALQTLLPGTVSSVFASQSAFVYILSMVFLGDKFLLIRISSVILSVGGIVLMGHSEGFDNSSTIGILFVSFAAFLSAAYQVAFKRIMGKANSVQVALFISILGIVSSVFFWPFIFLLDHFDYEKLEWTDLPWYALAGTALLGLVFNYLVTFGIAYTFPLFISIGTLLGVPLNAAVDAIFRGRNFGWLKIIALFMIIIGFVMLLVSNKKIERLERKVRTCGKSARNSSTKSSPRTKDEDKNVEIPLTNS